MTIRTWTNGAIQVSVDSSKCMENGDCVRYCPAGVYDFKEGKPVPVHLDQCVACGTCAGVCLNGAILHSASEP